MNWKLAKKVLASSTVKRATRIKEKSIKAFNETGKPHNHKPYVPSQPYQTGP